MRLLGLLRKLLKNIIRSSERDFGVKFSVRCSILFSKILDSKLSSLHGKVT